MSFPKSSIVKNIDIDIKLTKCLNLVLNALQLDTDEMTVEYAITRGFDKIVKLHLDPVWHQLGTKTKLLISDLKTLRLLLE